MNTPFTVVQFLHTFAVLCPLLGSIREKKRNPEFILSLCSVRLRRILRALESCVYKMQVSVNVDKKKRHRGLEHYLRKIKRIRENNRPILYLDETWVNFGHVTSKVWRDTAIKSARSGLDGYSTGLKTPSGKGGRLIVLNLGNERAFIVSHIQIGLIEPLGMAKT